MRWHSYHCRLSPGGELRWYTGRREHMICCAISRIWEIGWNSSCETNSIQWLVLLLLLSCVQLCATPEMAAHQAPPSLGFSRQEHWSGLPCPSPMHESEEWKWSRSVSRVQLLATPWAAAYQAPPPMGLSGQEYWSGLPLPSPVWNSTFSLLIICSILFYKVYNR